MALHHQHPPAAGGIHQRRATARTARRPVHGAQQVGIALDEDQRLALVEGVIAERHDIGARRHKAEEDVLGDAEAMRGILAIHHHEIGTIAFAQQGQFTRHRIAAAAADHVAQKDQPHAMVSCSVIT